MKKTTPALVLMLLCCTFVHAQAVAPQVIASGGNYISSASGSISYTIGEAVTPTLAGGGHILTQGFQQPTDIVNGLLDIEKEAYGSFTVYPIPATDKLWFGYEFPTQGLVKIELYNTLGQKLDLSISEAYESGKVVHSLDCTSYAAGQYILSATITTSDNDQKTLSKQFLIVK
ncbi:MAG: hypothetical protein JWO03_2190 [Bacteroidetes bacterium]|nr:hypothetical protein [Bacteroidota bacterium]